MLEHWLKQKIHDICLQHFLYEMFLELLRIYFLFFILLYFSLINYSFTCFSFLKEMDNQHRNVYIEQGRDF